MMFCWAAETGRTIVRPQTICNAIHARSAIRGLRTALCEHGGLLESLGISITEAAYRGCDATARVHIQQARLVLIDAIAVEKELRSLNGSAPRERTRPLMRVCQITSGIWSRLKTTRR